MNKQIKFIGYLTVVLSVALAAIAYYLVSGFWESLIIGLSTTFLGLGLAVIAVNHYLTSSDKKVAAKPLLKLIAPNVQTLQNKLFIGYGRTKFGKDQFETMINICGDGRVIVTATKPMPG